MRPMPVIACGFLLLTLAACRRAPEPEPAAATTAASPAATATVVPALAMPGPVAVTGVQTGTAVDGRLQVTAASEVFAPTDTIIAAITLRSAGAAPGPGHVTARWTGPDGKVFNEESRQQEIAGEQAVDFRVAEPAGFAPGTYTLEVSLDGKPVQTRHFTVR
jgi:hypothetical protein